MYRDRNTELFKRIPELAELETIIKEARETGCPIEVTTLAEPVTRQRIALPVYCLTMGSQQADVPALGFIAGVHGIERIGTQILIAYIRTLLKTLQWDSNIQALLQHIQLVFIPIVNPVGMWQNSRCNGQGVDLMRNAPVEAVDGGSFLVAGHRITRYLPWYRGGLRQPMEPENQAVIKIIKQQFYGRPLSIILDCHSGFGLKDRIWFPYARSREPASRLGYFFQLRELFIQTYPNHNYYEFEPQSLQYCTHGDLWDYAYDMAERDYKQPFLPLTLEMGSWSWVKKNPRQLLRYHGIFNPVLPHRQQRVLRRHLILFDFLMKLCSSYQQWQPDTETEQNYYQRAVAKWYGQKDIT